MPAPKQPTPQAISALLRRAGFAPEVRSGRSRRGRGTLYPGYSVMGCAPAPMEMWTAVWVWHMGAGREAQVEALARYAVAIRDKGWHADLEGSAPDAPLLVVTAALEDGDDDGERPRADTDCACPAGDDCPCEADGKDGLCACCRDEDREDAHRGVCAGTPPRRPTP